MSISYRYEGNHTDKDTLIDIIYCSSIQMSIPINYFFTVLLKDGTEYDLTDPKLKKYLKHPNDLIAVIDARDNYLKLF